MLRISVRCMYTPHKRSHAFTPKKTPALPRCSSSCENVRSHCTTRRHDAPARPWWSLWHTSSAAIALVLSYKKKKRTSVKHYSSYVNRLIAPHQRNTIHVIALVILAARAAYPVGMVADDSETARSGCSA